MYSLWVRLMLVASIVQLGISISDFADCRGRGCILRVIRASHAVLKVDWKPISVFPEEARALRSHEKR